MKSFGKSCPLGFGYAEVRTWCVVWQRRTSGVFCIGRCHLCGEPMIRRGLESPRRRASLCLTQYTGTTVYTGNDRAPSVESIFNTFWRFSIRTPHHSLQYIPEPQLMLNSNKRFLHHIIYLIQTPPRVIIIVMTSLYMVGVSFLNGSERHFLFFWVGLWAIWKFPIRCCALTWLTFATYRLQFVHLDFHRLVDYIIIFRL